MMDQALSRIRRQKRAAIGWFVLGALAVIGLVATGRWAFERVRSSATTAEFLRRVSFPGHVATEKAFPTARECARCHPSQVEAWRLTAHARAVWNPLVHASICGRCHAPLGTQRDDEYQLKAYDRAPMPGMPEAAGEGITCITCHAPVKLPEKQVLTFLPHWPNWRATDLALEILPLDAALGTFGQGTVDDPAPVANSAHASTYDPRLADAALCEPCHNVVVDKSPLAPHAGFGQPRVRLLTTYDEWRASPYAQSGQTCQSCHMPRQAAPGAAAIVPEGERYERPLPPRQLADHTIIGTTTVFPARGELVERQEALVRARLAGAAALRIEAPQLAAPGEELALGVVATNTGAGHELPTGFAYWSEAWFELTVTDARGRRLFASGDLDEDEWLRDEFNPRVRSGELPYDGYLVSLRARLVSVGPNRSRWLQEDGTLEVPPELIPRNYNGTPILGTADFAVDGILDQLYGGAPPRHVADALQEGYVLRFADTILRHGIPPRGTRRGEYRLTVPSDARGPLRVGARLLLRAYWPWMLKQQEELPTPRPKPTIYVVAQAERFVELGRSSTAGE